MVVGETITLHIGQAGIQAGMAYWTQLCAEHGIAPDGTVVHEKCDPDEFTESLFTPTHVGTYCPRAIMIDTDPGSLDWIKLGECRELYNPGLLISGKEDAAGCFAKGYKYFGRHFTVAGREKIRRVLENCDKFQGFMIMRSMTGGTGSGLSSILMQRVNDEFIRRKVVTCDILPTPQGGSTLDPYNVVLALHETMDVSDVSMLFSNKSLFRIASTPNLMGVKHPRFHHVNQIIATVASHCTSGMRFKCDLSMNFQELETNLVPLPRLKFPVLSYSPFCPPGRSVLNFSSNSIVNNLFTQEAQLVPCDTHNGRYISAMLLLQGGFQTDDINQYIHRLTSHPNTPVKFVDWLPPSVKYSMTTRAPIKPWGWDIGNVPRSAVGAFNHSGMEPVLRPYINSFRKMYCNKAFLHLYKQEGMEEQDFENALEDMLALQEDFRKIASDENPHREKKCVEITIPANAILDQRENTGRCDPRRCRRLNVDLGTERLKLRECDPGCGPKPRPEWRCHQCLGRYGVKEMPKALFGRGIYRHKPEEWRPPCITKEMLEEEERKRRDEAAARKKRRGGCTCERKIVCPNYY